MARASVFFPIVGAFQGLLAVLTAALSVRIFTPEIAGGLIILVLIISSGGFHLDGLSDTFDAMAVKSSGDKSADTEKRLSVMKDSTTGAIGVVAVVMAILLKFLMIDSLLHNSSSYAAYSLLFLMPVFSKWIMVPAMYHGTSARRDGLGRIFINGINERDLIYASLVTFLIVFLITGLFQYTANSRVAVFMLVLFAVLYIFGIVSVRFFKKMFGGLTGDTFGALSELSEILFLMAGSLWLRHFI